MDITNTMAHFLITWRPPLWHLICIKSAEEMSRLCTRLFWGESLQPINSSPKYDIWLLFHGNGEVGGKRKEREGEEKVEEERKKEETEKQHSVPI